MHAVYKYIAKNRSFQMDQLKTQDKNEYINNHI